MTANVRPKLTVLSADNIQQVHEAALTILEKTGIRVDDPAARRVFEKAVGGVVNYDRFLIPGDLVEWAIKAAPSRLELYCRDGKPGFELGDPATERTVFGIGVTNLYFQEPLNDTVVPFERKHMVQATGLGDALDEFDVIATPGVIQNVDPVEGELLGVLEMLANTKKPLILLVSDPSAFAAGLELIDDLIGIPLDRPFIMPYFNPITPLVLNAATTRKLDLAVSKSLPVIFSNYGMSGATCPITPGGTLALLTAELLAGLAYCQLLKEGTPVALGSLPAAFDMGSMLSMYSPQSMLLNLACAEMMSHYRIPHCGTSGGSSGWGPDLISGSIQWVNHLTSMLGTIGMVPFVGSNFDSLAFSPAAVVYAAEIIQYVREFSQGFSMEPEEIGLDEIVSLGPGASYLTSQSTLQKFKGYLRTSRVWPALSLEKWQEKGCPRAGNLLREYTAQLLGDIKPPEDQEQLLSGGEKFIRSVCKTLR
jgi:trimethylamine--corrinoid protein Co-methyltransferase